MNIIFIGQYFPPETGALAARASELAYQWIKDNHKVTILTGFPNYPSGVIPPEFRSKIRRLVYLENQEGYQVVRTWLTTFSNRTALRRVAGYVSFCLSSMLTGLFLRGSDVIIASSPPLTVGLAGWWLAKIKRIPFVLEIRDLWPESITASGVSNHKSLLIRVLSKLSGFLYQTSDHIIVVTSAFKREIISKWGIAAAKISVVHNGVETEIFNPKGSSNNVENEFAVDGNFLVSYIGNYGWAQGLKTIIETAELLSQEFSDIVFLFVGAGADEKLLRSQVTEKGLVNVRFLSQQPRENIPGLIRASDICLVPLRKAEVFESVIPSKMLEFMACGRPVVLGVDGQARLILESARGGVFVEPENSAEYAQAIRELYHNPILREQFGVNGRNFVVQNFSRRRTAKEYIKKLLQVIA